MIRRQLVIPVGAEQLWNALTDPDQVESWFGARVEWELRDGAPARFWGDDGVERHGQVDVVRPYRHLRFRWWPVTPPNEHDEGDGDGGTDVVDGTDRVALTVDDPWSDDPTRAARDDVALPGEAESEVSYVLEPDEGGTRLTVQERRIDNALRRRDIGDSPRRAPQRSSSTAPRAVGQTFAPGDGRHGITASRGCGSPSLRRRRHLPAADPTRPGRPMGGAGQVGADDPHRRFGSPRRPEGLGLDGSGRRTDDVDTVFAALSDPTRRRLLDQLSNEGPLTATQLSSSYPVSRQAVVKHLGPWPRPACST